MRRVLLIILATAVFLGIVALGYWLATGPARVQEEPGTGRLPTANAPQGGFGKQANTNAPQTPLTTSETSQAQKFGVVSDRQMVDYFVDKNNSLYFIELDGQVSRIINGQPSVISPTKIKDIISASFSYDGKKILLVAGNRSTPETSVFDIDTKLWEKIPLSIKNPTWSPSDYRIAFADEDGIKSLEVGNPKSKAVQLIAVALEDPVVLWPHTNTLFFFEEKPSSLIASSLWVFDLKTKKLTPVVQDALGLWGVWGAGTESMGLVARARSSDQGADLSLVLSNGKIYKHLSLPTTPSKCVFGGSAEASSSATLFCGVPRGQDFNTRALPDDYLKRKFFTSDDFYRINLSSGSTTALFSDAQYVLDAHNVKLFGGKLLFLNRYDQKLYAVTL